MAERDGSFPLVDLQVNGYLGLDFSAPDLSLEQIEAVCEAVAAAGTTGFLPTLVTCPLEVFERNLGLLADAATRPACRGILGVHLEGPFLCPEPGYIGAHNPAWVQPPDPALLRRLLAWGRGQVKLLTLASAVPGAERLVRAASRAGVVVALGHDAMTTASLDRAVRAGARLVTHLGNGLPLQLPRHPNAIWAALADDRLGASLILDGDHVPPEVLRVMLRVKGLARIVAVSDVSAVAGLPPGRYELGALPAEIAADGRVVKPGTEYLAGSGRLLEEALTRTRRALGLTRADCARIACDNPLALLGLTRRDLRRRAAGEGR